MKQYKYIGIIYNWKGLKEENYVYTIKELKKRDPLLVSKCLASLSWEDSKKCEVPWKTWMGKVIKDDQELETFLKGGYNEEPTEGNNDWYWTNIVGDDLYGLKITSTMTKLLDKFKIPEKYIERWGVIK